MIRRTPFVPMLAIALMASGARGQDVAQKLHAAGGTYDAAFGATVTFDADLALVTEYSSDHSGLVHVFQPSGPLGVFAETTTFAASDAAVEKGFGRAIARAGGTIVVGSPGYPWPDPFNPAFITGAAYVFERVDAGTPANPLDDQWVEVARLEAPVPAVDDWFGAAVACSGDTIVVGAPGVEYPYPATVAAYVFVRDKHGTADPTDDTWPQQSMLTSPPSGPATRLGACVGLLDGGTTALAGDPLDHNGAAGGLFRYGRSDNGTPANPLDDTWTALGSIETPGGVDDVMGDTLAISGNRLMCAGLNAGPFFASGRVYAFAWNNAGTPGVPGDDTFAPDGVIANPSGGTYSWFGRAIALDGDRALISPGGWNFPPSFGQETYRYQRLFGAWTPLGSMRAPDSSVNDGWGRSLAIKGNRALVGSPGGPYVDDDPGVEGAAYLVELDATSSWTDSGWNSWPHLAGMGKTVVGSPILLRVHQSFDAGAACAIVIGASTINAPLFGQVLVPAPTLVLVTALDSNFDGAELDLETTWPPGLPSGATIHIQALIDTFFVPPWTLTNDITVTTP